MHFLRCTCICCILILLGGCTSLKGETIDVHVELTRNPHDVEQALGEAQSKGRGTVSGNGTDLGLLYHAKKVIHLYIIPYYKEAPINMSDILHVELSPSVEEKKVTIPLTMSPSWRGGHQSYIITIISADEAAAESIGSAWFEYSILHALLAPLRHVMTDEAYQPSSYHVLAGYRILGREGTLLAGIVMIMITVIFFMLKKYEGMKCILFAIVTLQLLYGLRFGVDLLQFSWDHATELRGKQTYGAAGSIYSVAARIQQDIREHDVKSASVLVCRDGTNFKEKLLRYMLFPVTVSTMKTSQTSYLLVMDKEQWHRELIDAKNGEQTEQITCGDNVNLGEEIESFPDRSTLFRLSTTTP